MYREGEAPGKTRWWWDSSQGTFVCRKSGAIRDLGCWNPPAFGAALPPFHKGGERIALFLE